jgi:hypothetical protein
VEEEKEKRKSICVLCGKPWLPAVKNRCECGGFCTWGYELMEPESFTIDEEGIWHFNPVPKDILDKRDKT